jgi:hypothetical protein
VPATVVLVACTARKAASAQPPRRLYTSPWFQEAARCAEALGCWYVISAAHGLLDPNGPPLEPYDWVCLACGQTGVGRRPVRCLACGSRRVHRSTLAAFSAAERRAWGGTGRWATDAASLAEGRGGAPGGEMLPGRAAPRPTGSRGSGRGATGARGGGECATAVAAKTRREIRVDMEVTICPVSTTAGSE